MVGCSSSLHDLARYSAAPTRLAQWLVTSKRVHNAKIDMAGVDNEPLVDTTDGLLRGRTVESVLGDSYYSFQGIPYAEPPIGPLRFKPPQPIKPWSGTRTAFEEAATAPEMFLGTKNYLESSNEDCLYLNVYTTELPKKNENLKKPVLFWIHGGGFQGGSGNTDIYGPDYLLRKKAVVVTINYRLGALGFLSLQNDSCPGNFGLKDQVEALKWVQKNITVFGGDKDNVTIFGESAGGASVQYLMLSPLTRGLFHRAITQSGSVLNPWATARKPVEYAFALGEVLGFKTEDKNSLLEFLKKVPARDMVEKAVGLTAKVEPEFPFVGIPFPPVVELPSPDAFLTVAPEILITRGELHDVPYIVGINTLEGPIMLKTMKELLKVEAKEDYDALLPPHQSIERGSPLANSLLAQIKNLYLPNGFSKERFVDVMSWIYFVAGNEEALRGLSKSVNRKSNVYFYRFVYDGGLSFFKSLWGFSDWKGTFHADDLSYLFYANLVKPEMTEGTTDYKVMDAFTQMWTDFAQFGEPTPHTNQWKPYTKENKYYFEIGEEQVLKKNLAADEAKFWLDIYDRIRGFGSPKL